MRHPRRRFLAGGGLAAAGLALGALPIVRGDEAAAPPTRRAPNDRLALGWIGAGGRGSFLADLALKTGEADIVAVADVEAARLDAASKLVENAQGKRPRLERDYRTLLSDPGIDAVIVAVPHHWHGLIGLAALGADKHIYLEKPASHVFHEGRLLASAAQKSGKIFQHGTQMRSSPVTQEAARVLAAGTLGKIIESHAFGVEPRGTFPAAVADSTAPEGLNWQVWLGPAPDRPYNAGRHRDWNNYREYGNGEIGGDGIHDIDMARWGLGVNTHPIQIMAQGSRVKVRGETEFPDNMTVVYQYADGRKLIYENRNFAPYGQFGFDNANVFYGTEGYMVFSRRGFFQTYLGGKEEKGPGGRGSAGNEEHMANFLRSVRQGSPSIADAQTAHLSCALVHLGEIAYRTGRVLQFDDNAETIIRDDEAAALLSKVYRPPYLPG